MKLRILIASTLVCSLAAPAGAAQAADEETSAQVAFTKKVMVLGVPIYATNTVSDEKLLSEPWMLMTREDLKKTDPAIFAILSRPEYKLPTVLPDGKYKGTSLTIES